MASQSIRRGPRVRVVVFSQAICILLSSLYFLPIAQSIALDDPVEVPKAARLDDQPAQAEEFQRANKLVSEALCHEIYGRIEQAKECLKQAEQLNGDNASVNWRQGKVSLDGKWTTPEQVAQLVNQSDLLNAYRIERANNADNEHGHLQLAKWCVENGLVERAAVHLQRVLEFNPQNELARVALGHQKIDDRWFTFDELLKQYSKHVLDLKRVQAWKKDMLEIVRLAETDTTAAQEAAAQKIAAINDPSAIVAMELILGGRSNQMDRHLIDQIATINSLESVDSLCRFAVFHNDESIRKLAASKLKTRDLYDYVPPLLASMTGPWVSKYEIAANDRGQIVYRQTLFRQEQNEHRVRENSRLFVAMLNDRPGKDIVARKEILLGASKVGYTKTISLASDLYDRLSAQTNVVKGRFLSDEGWVKVSQVEQVVTTVRNPTIEIMSQAMSQINADLAETQMIQASQNLNAALRNQRICAALREATDEKMGDDPRQWWSWWNQMVEMSYEGSKGINYDRNSSTTLLLNSRPYEYEEHVEIQRAVLVMSSCLVAGTVIETERGPVAVEDIKTGDYVLTKETDTGQLIYKPVIRPTTRQPVDIFDIKLENETITATGGHLFWVSGEGWVKTRDLCSGMPIHTVDGITLVRSLTASGKSQTHNLIVADNHNYFVGKSRILSHDNSVRSPIDTVVPGLVESGK